MARMATAAELSVMRANVQADPRLSGIFSSLTPFLQASEYEVIEMMVHAGIWSGPVPNNPNPTVSGSVEFGLFDYWLNNPSNSVEWALQAAWLALVGPLPVTLINATNYNNLW